MLKLRAVNCFATRLLAAMLIFAASWTVQLAAGQGAAQTVRLIIDYGDGITKTVNGLAWSKGDTVLNAMTAAAARPDGISFSYVGSGSAAVMTKIEDVQNQGGGAGKKNWQYWVNGAYGDRSFAVFELKMQDVISWRFTSQLGQ